MPGTPFVISDTTKAQDLLSAIKYGQTTVEAALFALADLLESTTDADKKSAIKSRIECLKVLNPAKEADALQFSVTNLGIYSFLWAKVSEYVMKRQSLERASVDATSSSAVTSSFSARFHRPAKMNDFSEMMNLFIMICHGLAVCSVMVLTEFFAMTVYDLMRLRGENWMVAHEVMLIMFKRESGGRLTLGTIYDEVYLTSIMDEAKLAVATFFRSGGGNLRDDTSQSGSKVAFNGKFTASGRPCPHFNTESPKGSGQSAKHPADSLLPDGTCKFNHVCNKWVKNKGKNGRCLCTAGTPGHARFNCDNPDRCSECVQ